MTRVSVFHGAPPEVLSRLTSREDDDLDRPAQPPKRLLVPLGPAPGARLELQQPDALAAV
jgi:hypothetical protein